MQCSFIIYYYLILQRDFYQQYLFKLLSHCFYPKDIALPAVLVLSKKCGSCIVSSFQRVSFYLQCQFFPKGVEAVLLVLFKGCGMCIVRYFQRMQKLQCQLFSKGVECAVLVLFKGCGLWKVHCQLLPNGIALPAVLLLVHHKISRS